MTRKENRLLEKDEKEGIAQGTLSSLNLLFLIPTTEKYRKSETASHVILYF